MCVCVLTRVDVMLDAYGYKATAEDSKQFDSLAREIFKQETGQENLENIISHDQNGNLWIYASEETKQYAAEKSSRSSTPPASPSTQRNEPPPSRPSLKALTQIVSSSEGENGEGRISRAESEPAIPSVEKGKEDDGGYAYAKTLRLTSEQLVWIPQFLVECCIDVWRNH